MTTHTARRGQGDTLWIVTLFSTAVKRPDSSMIEATSHPPAELRDRRVILEKAYVCALGVFPVVVPQKITNASNWATLEAKSAAKLRRRTVSADALDARITELAAHPVRRPPLTPPTVDPTSSAVSTRE
ncbi:MAG: hypothetical protein JWN43_3012 [Gammaproteobacteria bacterium]|nr:hypothetical protein [Gammaproteobacteria bacterium]